MNRVFSKVNRQFMVIAIIFLVTGLLLAGCGRSDERPEFLTAHEWVHYDSASNETICFGEDGHFAFYGDEGNPVGNSDLYDRYSYDSESKAIKLEPEGDMKIKVLRHEKSRLLLDIDGDVKEFFDGKDERIAGGAPQNLEYDLDNVVSGFGSYLAIIGKDGSKIVTAPANYDGDDPEFKEYELSEKLADHATFYSWVYDVDESGMDVKSNYRKVTEKEAAKIISDGAAVGFVWYNEKAEITKIVFWGSTVTQ